MIDDLQSVINTIAISDSLRTAADALGIPWKECRESYLRGLAAGLKPTVEKTASTRISKITKGAVKPLIVVYFTDSHNQPGMSVERFKWLGKFINELAPDAVVDGGDFDDMESLCSHVKNDTFSGKFKPAFTEDLAASEAARAAINAEIKIPVKKHHMRGNHEDRLYQFEDRVPELYSMMQHAYEDIQSRYGWQQYAFREYLDIGGVDFTHIPMNGMNKALGGKRCAVNVAAQSIKDVCFGHTHNYSYWEEAKLGPNRSTIAINGGCFMPDGYIPSYAKGGQKSPWYGLHVLNISNGRIDRHTPVTIKELRDRYS